MRTSAISRRGEQFVPNSAQAQNHEERLSFPPPERTAAEGTWTPPQQRLLAVLQLQEYRGIRRWKMSTLLQLSKPLGSRSRAAAPRLRTTVRPVPNSSCLQFFSVDRSARNP